VIFGEWDGAGKVASYPRYPRDYANDTQLLTLEEHGAYCLLLDYQWLHGEIPASDAARAMLWRCPLPRARRIWATLERYFPATATGSRLNRRLEREREKSQKRMARAQKGAAAKHAASTPTSTPQADAKQVLAPCSTPASVSVSVSSSNYPGPSARAREAKPGPQPPASTARDALPQDYRPDLDALLAASHAPDALTREILTLAEGRHPTIHGATPDDLGLAIRELRLAGAPQSKLATFVRTAIARRLDPAPARQRTRAARRSFVEIAAELDARDPEPSSTP